MISFFSVKGIFVSVELRYFYRRQVYSHRLGRQEGNVIRSHFLDQETVYRCVSVTVHFVNSGYTDSTVNYGYNV